MIKILKVLSDYKVTISTALYMFGSAAAIITLYINLQAYRQTNEDLTLQNTVLTKGVNNSLDSIKWIIRRDSRYWIRKNEVIEKIDSVKEHLEEKLK